MTEGLYNLKIDDHRAIENQEKNRGIIEAKIFKLLTVHYVVFVVLNKCISIPNNLVEKLYILYIDMNF